MQKFTLIIGGLETNYMQKLAVYLKSRMGGNVQVVVADGDGESDWTRACNREKIPRMLIGSRTWIHHLLCKVQQVGAEGESMTEGIVLSPDDSPGADEIRQFQSGEAIYRQIWQRCEVLFPAKKKKNRDKRQFWDLYTGDTAQWKRMVYATVWAEICGREEAVLYIPLEECSFMEQLYEVESEYTLEDLFLDLRRGNAKGLKTYVRSLGHFDYLPPLRNPEILHELNGDDIEHMLQYLEHQDMYSRIVFLLGNTCCNCEQIIAYADVVTHVMDRRDISVNGLWLRFIRQYRTEEQQTIVQLQAGMPGFDCPGIHLLEQWADGQIGKDLINARTMAIDAGPAGDRAGPQQGCIR